MATTTNYGWTTPDDTALVKDGASAIRTLGTAIDTTTFNNAAAAIAKTIVDAKGDIIAATAADTVSRLAVGTNGQVLTADSTAATGLAYTTISTGGMTLLSTTTLSGASTTISSIDQTYTNLYLIISGVTNATANGQFRCAPNGSTNITSQLRVDTGGSPIPIISTSLSYLFLTGSYTILRTNSNNIFTININNYASTTAYKSFEVNGQYNDVGGTDQAVNSGGGIGTNSAITSLVFSNAGGNLSTGTVLIYGVK